MDNKTESRVKKHIYVERKTRLCFHIAEKHSESKGARRRFLGLAIRVLFALFVFSIQQVCAMLTRNDAEKLQQMLVYEEEDVEWVVNPYGPLSPFGLYIYNKTGYMHTHRFFNTYIDAYYNISGKNNNQFIRDPTNDQAYFSYSDGSEVPKEVKEYYTTLINMFPSPNHAISIYPKEDCKDSFTLFLKSNLVKEHAHTILAALLLRTEGMDIPLSIKYNKTKIPYLAWKGGAHEAENFSLEIVVPCSEMQEDDFRKRRCELLQYKSEQVIKFFLRMNSLVQSGIKDSMATEEKIGFWEDEFCDSKSWLIQSYIYYYLETKEDAACFNRTVYTMLDEHIKKCERENRDGQKDISEKFLKRCFMQCDSLSDELKYWRKIEELEGTIEVPKKKRLLPFTDSEHAPIRTTVDVQICDDTYLTTDVFLTDVESALLGLFCCFAYDPDCVIYSVGHMKNSPNAVRDFFSNIPSSLPIYILNREIGVEENLNRINPLGSIKLLPGKEIPMDVQKAWKNIVRDCCSADLRFNESNDDNALAGGILNVLTAILQLAGEYNEVNKEKIESFKDELLLMIMSRTTNDQIVKDIQEYAETLFASLSQRCTSCDGLVEWYNYKSDESERKRERKIFISFISFGIHINGNEIDLYGSMQIYYAYKNQAQPIILHLINADITHLEIGKKVVRLDKSKANAREEVKKELETSLKENSFIQHILFDYIKKIESYTLPEYVIADPYIAKSEELEYRDKIVSLHYMQPTQYISATKYGVVDCLLNRMYITPNYIRTILDKERYLNNILISTPVSSIENLLFLIVCISSRRGNIYDNLEEIRKATQKSSMPRDDITIKVMVKIVSILLRCSADIDLANVLAAYAQIYWGSDKMCIAKIVEKHPRQKDRILKCLDRHMTVKRRKSAKKRKMIMRRKPRMNPKRTCTA
ncbi:uncharacterized protein NESG_00530 [Nematocida ausubeli]|uniref:Uncharacterized protein n=1 Tax=Nematocida ausubeli (strain ATCC PRA-371 / ERTm2) TaxID=1913371 RepID=A0A086J5N3_NEMA1|nr:uncharacterized protein NESG_00530 [Nematocida ausubeli]KFG27451.1 hypothetical protein NESG_00530 [Nematocida ausubeli]